MRLNFVPKPYVAVMVFQLEKSLLQSSFTFLALPPYNAVSMETMQIVAQSSKICEGGGVDAANIL